MSECQDLTHIFQDILNRITEASSIPSMFFILDKSDFLYIYKQQLNRSNVKILVYMGAIPIFLIRQQITLFLRCYAQVIFLSS